MMLSRNFKLIAVFTVLLIAGVIFITQQGSVKPEEASPQTNNSQSKEQNNIASIRSFMAQPELELTFVNTDLPMPYFRVGKATQMGTGENMEAVEGWTRKVNVYDQKELVNGECSIYEYHTDARDHTLTAVIIRGLRPGEVDSLKNNGVTCVSNSSNLQKITKADAEAIAMGYLKRALSNFDQIKDQFAYSQQKNGESHEWLWEDKSYQLPNGLSGRPYPYPIIRISIYGNNQIQYWNTVSLFQN